MPMLSVPQWYIEKLAIRRAVLIGSKTKPIQIVVATLQKKKAIWASEDILTRDKCTVHVYYLLL